MKLNYALKQVLCILNFDFEKIMKAGKILLIRFSSEDLANIPDWQGYAKAQLTSSNVQPFGFATEKDARAFYPSRAKQHRNHTKKHYGMHYQDVDGQIAGRRVSFMSRWIELFEKIAYIN